VYGNNYNFVSMNYLTLIYILEARRMGSFVLFICAFLFQFEITP